MFHFKGVQEIFLRVRTEDVGLGTRHFFGMTQGCVEGAAGHDQGVWAAEVAAVDPASEDGEQATGNTTVETAVEEH